MSFRPVLNTANQQRTASRGQAQLSTCCARCRRYFVNQRALDQHRRHSSYHHVCSGCDIDYETRDEMEACQCDDDSEGQSAPTDEESVGTASDEGIAHAIWADITAGWGYGYGYGYRNGNEDYHMGYYQDSNSNTDEWTNSEGWDDESATGSGESTGTLEEDDSPFPQQENEPYCLRCNRHFQTLLGYRSHCRMSRAHPWWCNQCYTDFDREDDLNTHIATNHNNPIPLSYQNPPLSQREYPNLREAMAAQSAEAATRRASDFQFGFGGSNTTTRGLFQTHPQLQIQARQDIREDINELRERLDGLRIRVTDRAGRVGDLTASGSRSEMSAPRTSSSVLNSTLGFGNSVPSGYSRPLSEFEEEERSGSFLMPGAFIESPDTPTTAINRPPAQPASSTTASTPPTSSETRETAKATDALNLTCPLCLDHPQVLTSTLCGHLFCKECITLALRRKPECPVCRAFSHVPSLHPIYLNVTGTVV